MILRKKLFSKNTARGFTLVEIIVVLVILAVTATSTIPSMLGFINGAKEKSMSGEVRAIYTAAQAYAIEHLGMGDSDDVIETALNKEFNSSHGLYPLLQNGVTGRISGFEIRNGKVEHFVYTKDNIKADYSSVSGVKFSKDDSDNEPVVVKSTIFGVGSDVSEKIKKLAGNSSATYTSSDKNIEGIIEADESDFLATGIDVDDSDHIISASDAEYKIHAWYENHNIYYYTEADCICLNPDSSYLFYRCKSLSDISALQNWDVSNVTALSYAFYYCEALPDLMALESWNTSNLVSLNYAFYYCNSLTNLTGLQKWDTSNVALLEDTFHNCKSLMNITALQNWNTENLTSLWYTFNNCTSLSDATCLDDWKTSKIENKEGTFVNTIATANGKLPRWY